MRKQFSWYEKDKNNIVVYQDHSFSIYSDYCDPKIMNKEICELKVMPNGEILFITHDKAHDSFIIKSIIDFIDELREKRMLSEYVDFSKRWEIHYYDKDDEDHYLRFVMCDHERMVKHFGDIRIVDDSKYVSTEFGIPEYALRNIIYPKMVE